MEIGEKRGNGRTTNGATEGMKRSLTDRTPFCVLLPDALDRVQLHVDDLPRTKFCEDDVLHENMTGQYPASRDGTGTTRE